MMKAVCRVVTVCASLLAVSASAHAAPIMLSGGTAGTIPGGTSDNIFLTLLPGLPTQGFYGAEIEVAVPMSSTLLFEFFGAEADFKNAFAFQGNELAHPGATLQPDGITPVPGSGTIVAPNLNSPLDFFVSSFSSGSLPFQFLINGGPAVVANGSNPDALSGPFIGGVPLNGVGPNFFAVCDPLGVEPGTGGRGCSSVYLFLDDGGAGPDDNHDDFLVRVSVTPVPEPATLTLLGVGLAGLAGRRLRRSRKSGSAASTPSA